MDWGNRIKELEQRLRTVETNRRILHLAGGSGGAFDEEFSWASTDQAAGTVLIRGGPICSGTNEPVIVPDGTVRVTSGTAGTPSYAYVKWRWGSNEAEIVETAVVGLPVDTEDFLQRAVEAFYIENGQIKRARKPRGIYLENVAT